MQTPPIHIQFYNPLARCTEESADLAAPLIIRFFQAYRISAKLAHNSVAHVRSSFLQAQQEIRFPIQKKGTAFPRSAYTDCHPFLTASKNTLLCRLSTVDCRLHSASQPYFRPTCNPPFSNTLVLHPAIVLLSIMPSSSAFLHYKIPIVPVSTVCLRSSTAVHQRSPSTTLP